MTNYRIERAKDHQDLARQACETVAAQIDLALDQRDRCQIALSGGSTPASAYSLLGQERLPWDRTGWMSCWVTSAGWLPKMRPATPACCAALCSHPGLELQPLFIPCPPWNWRALRPVPRLLLTSFLSCA